MTEMMGSDAFAMSAPTVLFGAPIGIVLEIAGSSSQVMIDSHALVATAASSDPAIAGAG